MSSREMAEGWRQRWRELRAGMQRAWFGVGVGAAAKAIVKHLRRGDPEVNRQSSAVPSGAHPFDETYGVQTGGFVGWRDLQSGEANDPYISGYFGTTPSIGRRLIACVERPEDYTFIDVGCGKGRVVILASERAFRRVVGVEIVGALAAVARENAAAVAARFPERTAIEVVHDDAAQFAWPAGPLVLFLYQPFERPVMRAVLQGLTDLLHAAPRPVVLIYLYPALAKMVDQVGIFERRVDGALAPTEEERPHSYGGRGDTDAFIIWGTRDQAPALASI